jgi:hypothetical protein
MIGLSLTRSRPALPRLLVLCAGIAWALIAWRNVPLFGLTALPVLALHVDSEWRRLPDRRGIRGRFAQTAGKAATAIWIIPAALAMLLLGFNRGRVGRAHVIASEFDESVFPVAAVRYAKENRLGGRIFGEFTWNGYLEYAWPEQKIFIDGGTDFFGEELFREYATVKHLGAGWRAVLRRWDIAILMVKRQSALAREAVRGGDWKLVYCDSLAVLLRRTVDVGAIRPAQADSAEQELLTCPGNTVGRPSAGVRAVSPIDLLSANVGRHRPSARESVPFAAANM